MSGDRRYDLAIIGAGINGAGIARDAALRGLDVIVFDKADLCSGTSAWSSRLIHGGLRYLEYGEVPLVFESLRERRALQITANHLVKPLRLCIPIYESGRRGPLLIRIGMLAYDLLSFRKRLPNHDMLSRKEIIAAEPGLLTDGLRGAARYYDAQVTYAERLVVENLIDARDAGATISTYTEVTGIDVEDHKVTRVEYRNAVTGETGVVDVAFVVNAAGPWVDAVLRTAPTPTRQLIGGTKGSHIIVGAFADAPRDAYYVEAAADGRPFFIIPWNGQFLIGTTDIRFDGDLDTTRASAEEIDYLLAETNRVLPHANLRVADIHYAYAGVRPLPHRERGPESAITRRHIIKSNRRIARNLISIIGGKLTTYRSLAEQTVNKVGKRLDRKLRDCHTHDTRLPGAHRLVTAREVLAGRADLSDAGAQRLLNVYGGRAIDIVQLADEKRKCQGTLDAGATVLAAEVSFAIREEFARTLADIVHRRMMIGLDADQGRPLYAKIADLAAREFGWDEAMREREFAALIAYSDSFRVA